MACCYASLLIWCVYAFGHCNVVLLQFPRCTVVPATEVTADKYVTKNENMDSDMDYNHKAHSILRLNKSRTFRNEMEYNKNLGGEKSHFIQTTV